MSRFYIPGLVFVLLIVEGTLFQLMTPTHTDSVLVPRFLIVMVVLIGLHFGRQSSLFYGLAFGFCYDIVYTQLLGVYAFGLAFIGYFFIFFSKRIQDSLLIQLMLVLSAILFFEYYQYGLYLLIGLTDLPASSFAIERLLPSLILNSAFAILIYYPARKLFEHVKKQANLRAR
ncbi:rod shape-determining protein MreD [Alkalihalobacillus oceani]|uniref:Rod shape-determining protein MreD n=1 Tax=Halalkalibacter oceani TaxID=1653776 RepID=A0A9X2DRG1_9BACI|nr:rod shape-determining protein MreD [Halalkalibacter oceani]